MHIFIPGDYVCREGSNQPDGMVSIRKGAVVLEIVGIEVRQVGDCQTVGEDPHPGSGTDAGTREKNGWTTCDFEPPPSATPQHVLSSAGAHQKQQRATESGAIRTTTCDPMNISDWRRVIQEEWTVPAPAT